MVRGRRIRSIEVLLEPDEPAPLEPEGAEVRNQVSGVPLHGRSDRRDSAGLEIAHQGLAERFPHTMALECRIDPDDPDPSDLLVLAEVPRTDVPDEEPDDLSSRLRDEACVPLSLRDVRGEAAAERRGLLRSHDRALDLHRARDVPLFHRTDRDVGHGPSRGCANAARDINRFGGGNLYLRRRYRGAWPPGRSTSSSRPRAGRGTSAESSTRPPWGSRGAPSLSPTDARTT